MNIHQYNIEYLKRRILYKYGISVNNLFCLKQGDLVYARKLNDYTKLRLKCFMCNYNSTFIILNDKIKCIWCKEITIFNWLRSDIMFEFIDLNEIPNIVI